MSEIKKDGTGFVGYEYLEKKVPEGMVSLYLDSYPCFGWMEDPNLAKDSRTGSRQGQILRFRRERKICNKAELTRLQRNFDACVSEIQGMKKSGTSTATACAISVGVAGTALMAGATFAAVAEPPNVIWSTIFAVPGFVCWGTPYYVYKSVVKKREEKMALLVEKKYEEIYELCGKGTHLLI